MGDRFATRRETQLRRKTQTCTVYKLKIDLSHLTTNTLNHLHSLFKEAKWFYNYCIQNIKDADTKIKKVLVKVKDKYEERTFTTLQAQMKQAIKERLKWSLSSLCSLKQNGHKVGRLKFKNIINSIPLRQLNQTYHLDFTRKRVKIQGLKQWLKVRGLRQIPDNVEFANAILLRKNDNFYLNVTTFTNAKKERPGNDCIGIDFGCETQLTFSNGVKVQFQVPISKRLRKLDRKIMRRNRPSSKNKEKDKAERRKEYEHLTNKKTDIRHKLVNAITSNYKYVCFQNENIHAWSMCGHGKKIQSTGIGEILSDLKNKAVTPIMVDRFFPSTQLCPECGKKNKHGLSERTYKCGCGYIADRDVKSARCIMEEGMKKVPADCREVTPVETTTTTFLDTVSKITGVLGKQVVSQKQEAF